MERRDNCSKTEYWKMELIIFGLYDTEKERVEEMKQFLKSIISYFKQN